MDDTCFLYINMKVIANFILGGLGMNDDVIKEMIHLIINVFVAVACVVGQKVMSREYEDRV
jgi:hypothetical protein